MAKLGHAIKKFLDWPGTDHVPQLYIPKYHLERAGLPGVQTHRLAGGTSHSQRQQDQLTTEITRW